MKKNLPTLSWLRAFEASARHLSFTNAAGELNLTQAAISKQVKLLEQYLREPLFHRKPRSLVLTKIGAAYLPKVRDSFERLEAGTNEVFGNRHSEVLTIRVIVGFSVNWLAPRLHRFLDQHPGLELRIVSSVWNEQFDHERFDLDIKYGTGNWPGFHSERLTWENLMPLCSPCLLSGPNKLQTPDDLRHHKLLHVLGYEEGWAVWLKAAGVDDINPGQGLQFDNSLLALKIAATGTGVALGRSSMIGDELSSGRLVAPFDLAVAINEGTHLLSPLNGPVHRDAELFRNWILGEALADRVQEPK